MKRLTLLSFLFAAACQQERVIAQTRSELPRVTQVDNDRVHTLLAPDAIPSIDAPKFVRASEATFMDDDRSRRERRHRPRSRPACDTTASLAGVKASPPRTVSDSKWSPFVAIDTVAVMFSRENVKIS